MNLWIVSDLHLEFGEPFVHFPPIDADVLVCAGDILTKGANKSIEWLAANLAPSLPVVFVAGNHEFYGSSVLEGVDTARGLRQRYPHIHFLENEAVEIDGVRFVGGTLWTDFRLGGANPELSMASAQTEMNDYRRIKYSKSPFQKFKPMHAFRKHLETRAFLSSEMNAKSRKTVIVTHHAPSIRSIAPEFWGDRLSSCYGSDMDTMIIEGKPSLWIHGHVHHHVDYLVGETRVVANPRGYPGERSGFEGQFIVDV
jgi:Icc-related predicted phosphoesterase